MRNLKSTITALGILSSFLFSCEDKINPSLESAVPIMAVDAWLNNRLEDQIVVLTQTQTYFDASLPPGIQGATVTITDDKGGTFSFVEDPTKAGNYVWKPTANAFGTVGNKYTLHIQANGESFEAVSPMGRVPEVDSITFDATKRLNSKDSIVRAQFWATDPVGPGDAYWIRTYKNSVLLSKPSEINVAFDAGLSAGGDADGVVFITPIRRGINSNDKDPNTSNNLSPIVAGDSINVQIHSISLAAFNYLNQVATQTDRPGGFQELFSTPLANVSTNVFNMNSNGSKVVGFFNVSAVAKAGKRYKKK